jgi:hypothetical protein
MNQQYPPSDPNVSNGFQPQHQQQYQAQYQPPKKSHKGRTVLIVISAVIGVIVVIGIASAGGGTPDAATTQAPNTVATTKPAATKTTQPVAPKITAPAAKKWVKMVTLSGSADKTSDTIKTTGGKVRITYDFRDPSGSGMIVAAVYLLDEGTDLAKDGGIPEVMITEAGKDSTTVRKDAGEYYLNVSAANTKYTITVEEER